MPDRNAPAVSLRKDGPHATGAPRRDASAFDRFDGATGSAKAAASVSIDASASQHPMNFGSTEAMADDVPGAR